MHYGYLNNGTICSLSSSGSLQMTIPIQVCEGEFLSKPTVSSRLSIPYLIKDVLVKVKLKTPSTRIRQQEYLISFAAPENCATNHAPSSNRERNYHELPSLAMFGSQLPSDHPLCCFNSSLSSACEGDSRVRRMALAVHPILASVQVFVESHPMSSPSSLRVIVVSNHYCHMALKNIAMHHRLNCEGDCSQFHQPNRASTSADRISQAASSKVKKKGSVHHVTIYIRMRHQSKCQRPISGQVPHTMK